jgi:hypothetical protein
MQVPRRTPRSLSLGSLGFARSHFMRTSREERPDEFREIEISALRYLMQPHSLPKAQSLDKWSPQLYLWHFPSFTAHRSWAIYQHRDRGARIPRTLLRQSTWDYAADSKRLFEPLTGLGQGFHVQPTMEVRDRPLDGTSFEKRLALLRLISFPAFCARGLGIDGETFGIAFPQPGARIEWWCDGPESWRELTRWAAEARAWLSEIAAAPPQTESESPFRPRIP